MNPDADGIEDLVGVDMGLGVKHNPRIIGDHSFINHIAFGSNGKGHMALTAS